MTTPAPRFGQRALDRFRSRSVWWFVALAVLVAFFPISGPVQLGLYALMFVAFWLPLLRHSATEARRGYDEDPRL